jgi:hypothetical protein
VASSVGEATFLFAPIQTTPPTTPSRQLVAVSYSGVGGRERMRDIVQMWTSPSWEGSQAQRAAQRASLEEQRRVAYLEGVLERGERVPSPGRGPAHRMVLPALPEGEEWEICSSDSFFDDSQ